MSRYYSLDPVRSAEVAALKPEFLRIPPAVAYSGLSRSTLYELIAEDRLKSTVVRKRDHDYVSEKLR